MSISGSSGSSSGGGGVSVSGRSNSQSVYSFLTDLPLLELETPSLVRTTSEYDSVGRAAHQVGNSVAGGVSLLTFVQLLFGYYREKGWLGFRLSPEPGFDVDSKYVGQLVVVAAISDGEHSPPASMSIRGMLLARRPQSSSTKRFLW